MGKMSSVDWMFLIDFYHRLRSYIIYLPIFVRCNFYFFFKLEILIYLELVELVRNTVAKNTIIFLLF